jgi:diguanylate cyclase (GGDEF)-like protein/PAS domain S-box-containing protein
MPSEPPGPLGASAGRPGEGDNALRQLRAVIDHLPAIVGYWNRDLRNEFGNAAYQEWFGVSPQDLRGRHVREVLGEALYAAHLEQMQAALAGTPQRFESELVDAGGRVRHTQSSYIPDIVDGQVCGFVVLAADISARIEAERALARSAEQYRALVRSIPGGFVLQFDHDLRFVVADGDALAAFGLLPEQLEGRTLAEAFTPELAAELEPRYRDALAGTTSTWDRIRGDRVFCLTAGPVRDRAGRIFGGTVVCHEVTAERRSEAVSKALHTIAALIAASAPLEQILASVAEQLREVFLLEHAGVARFTGPERFDFVAVSPPLPEALPTLTVSPGDATAVSAVASTGKAAIVHYDLEAPGLLGVASRGPRAGAAVPVSVNGELWGAVGLSTSDPGLLDEAMLTRLAGFGDLVAVAVANDRAWATLTHRAVTDALTGVGNRRAFYDALAREVRRARRHGRRLSVALIDIDNFKRINDTHGHQAGDQALTLVAQRLLAATRASEMIGRIGGEEFGWLLPEATAAEALLAAERARCAVAEADFGQAGRLTVSVGVATLAGTDGPDELVRAADEALYAAKAGGRNTIRIAAQQRVEDDPAPR